MARGASPSAAGSSKDCYGRAISLADKYAVSDIVLSTQNLGNLC
jgi:hypothetical protein